MFSIKRQFPRLALKLPIEVESFGVRRQAESVEVGGGGMSLAQVEDLAISLPIAVDFQLPEQGERLRIHAVVWWKKNGLVGIRFDPSDPSSAPLKQWIDRHLNGGQATATSSVGAR